MSEIGRSIRTERISDRKSGNMVIVPMDHGVTIGPVKGLIDLQETINKVAKGGATAVLQHKGNVQAGHRGYGEDIGLIIHLSASTSLGPDPNNKVQVCSEEEALKLGADAVSVHINVGSDTEASQLKSLGATAEKCAIWGIPLLAMMYPRGQKVQSEHDVKHVKLAARVGAELGADIIKTNYPGSIKTFEEVTQGCPVPVVIAGGEKMDTDEELLQMVEDSITAGGRGVSIGRNVFQHEDVVGIVKSISKIVKKA